MWERTRRENEEDQKRKDLFPNQTSHLPVSLSKYGASSSFCTVALKHNGHPERPSAAERLDTCRPGPVPSIRSQDPKYGEILCSWSLKFPYMTSCCLQCQSCNAICSNVLALCLLVVLEVWAWMRGGASTLISLIPTQLMCLDVKKSLIIIY